MFRYLDSIWWLKGQWFKSEFSGVEFCNQVDLIYFELNKGAPEHLSYKNLPVFLAVECHTPGRLYTDSVYIAPAKSHNNLLSSYWPAHRMGIYFNSLINGLIQHTFKINKISETDFQLWTSPPSKKMSSYWKFIEVTHSRKSGRSRGSGVIIILLKLFFLKIPDLVHRRTAAPVAAETCP